MKRLAVALGVPSALVLSLTGAAAIGALASTPGTLGATGQHRDRDHGPTPATASATSCTTVGHIGDSTSVGMVSPEYLPDPGRQELGRRGLPRLLGLCAGDK